jgi:hypothetical protein
MEDRIERVEYRGGMLEQGMAPSDLPTYSWDWADLPAHSQEQILKDRAWELAGCYGDPAAGEPIEYHYLKLARACDEAEIEFFNLAITMFFTDDEDLQRIFRTLDQVSELVRRPDRARARQNGNSPPRKRKA